MSDYFVGQGKIYIANRDVSNNPEGFVYLGNCPSFKIKPGTTGIRNVTNPTVLGPMQIRSRPGTFEATLEEFTLSNLAQGFYGGEVSVNAGTPANESVVARKGYFVPVANIGISSVVVKNEAESITYDLNDDYTVEEAGGINVLSTGAIVDASIMHISYSHLAHNVVAAFSEAPEVCWLRFNGINVASGLPVVVDIYKIRTEPIDMVQLISVQFSNMVLKGKISYDAARAGTTTWGNYFRIRSA